MSSKILVTGATGFVGRYLIDKLLEKQLDVVALVRSATCPFDGAKSVFVPRFGGDSDFSDAVAGSDCIIHCAARVSSMQEETLASLESYLEVNTRGTAKLARQAADSGVKRFIFISSIKVNGDSSPLGGVFKAADERAPQDFYGFSKSEAEKQLLTIGSETGMEVVIIRPTIVYGPGVKANFASLMKLVSRGIPLPFGSISHNQRSLVSVENLVDLIVTCIDHPNAANETFLVSDDNDVSTSKMVRQMAIALEKPIWQLPVPVWCYRLAGKLFGKSDVVDRLLGSLQVDITHT
ncbi:UDP-glucose 4-epimerase family protein, partial [Vibrio parahaemolyticus]|uniref:UDP-glucose 4-epimerase family protein n=1 Tax=Vibrio parahaemolyticus TaxID=670 RepID=UPI001E3DAAE1